MKSSSKQPTILILGSEGLLGRVVYTLLSQKFPGSVWRSSRMQKDGYVKLQTETFADDFKAIETSIGHIDYCVNCIALLGIYPDREAPLAGELTTVNALFPLALEQVLTARKTKLIHISTDAVFAKMAGTVDESATVGPDTTYGASKYLGETSSPLALTLRTTVIGFDPKHHKGLFELLLQGKKQVAGFSNQQWSGCTSLQCAQFILHMIENNVFDEVRSYGPVLHVAPLQSLTKFDLLEAIAKHLEGASSVEDVNAPSSQSRRLTSAHIQLLVKRICGSNLHKAIEEVIAFEPVVGREA